MDNIENKKKKAIVFGAGRSGIAASTLLAREGYQVLLVDEMSAPARAMNKISELAAAGVSCRFGNIDYSVLDGADLFILSPGIPPSHPFVEKSISMKILTESELELASRYIHSQMISTTGTNGKTTVTTLINNGLSDFGIPSAAAGNIGRALCDVALTPMAKSEEAILSVEVSSFQLELISSFHPHIALILNITPDHMDRYSTFDDYKNAKFNIIKNMNAIDFLILNAEDKSCLELREKVRPSLCWFSSKFPVKHGAYLENGKLWINSNEKIFLMNADEIPIVGMHNIENVLASSLALFLAGVSPESIRKTVMTFTGVEHRIEACGNRDNIRFYNDSKSTNLDSLRVALQAFSEPIVLIAGGRGVETAYDDLIPLIEAHVKKMITLGEKAEILEKHWGAYVPCERALSMDNAVELSIKAAVPGDVVLLSPGHKSFDLYKNYEERGRDFKDCVRRRLL